MINCFSFGSCEAVKRLLHFIIKSPVSYNAQKIVKIYVPVKIEMEMLVINVLGSCH